MSNISQLKELKRQIVFFKNYINPWIYFILLVHIFQSKKECQNAILGIMILVFLTSATGLVDQFTSIDLGTKTQGLLYEEGRSSGFGEANQYAAFLVLLLPAVVSCTIFKKQLVQKTLYAFIFLVGFIGLIATVSRGGYIGFFIATVAFFIMSIRHNLIKVTRTFLLLILIVPIVGTFTYIALPSATKVAFRYKVIEKAESKKYVNPWSRNERSKIDRYTSGRIGKWTDSFELFLQSPVWGHGNYTIKKVLRISPHNEYLKILIKYGIIGFILFIMIYVTIFRQICMKIRNAPSDFSKMIYIGFISGFIGYMVCMFGVGFTQPRYIFWIMTAAVIKYSQLDEFDLVES
jgi:O-antigen ligase